MNYDIEIRKNKSLAKCRVCKRNIPNGLICVFIKINDGYKEFQMVTHADCFLEFIIKEVKKIQIEDLNKEMEKFKVIEKILKSKKTIKILEKAK